MLFLNKLCTQTQNIIILWVLLLLFYIWLNSYCTTWVKQ